MIYVIGMPGTGKTTLAFELAAQTGLSILHTDNYIVYDPERTERALWVETGERVAAAVREVRDERIIVEGVQVARLLPRPGQPDPHDIGTEPDLVVWCRGPTEHRDHYATMRWILERAAFYQRMRPERVLVRTLRRTR